MSQNGGYVYIIAQHSIECATMQAINTYIYSTYISLRRNVASSLAIDISLEPLGDVSNP